MPFLTLLDPNARIKGSRDPLGFEVLWSGLGRKVIGNLTTITTNYPDFHTTLLAYYFANPTHDVNAKDSEVLKAFLRIEQLIAYARFNTDRTDGFRGINEVKRKWDDSKVHINEKSEFQILADQKVYGVWGLFSTALRECGLLHRDGRALTPQGLQLVEQELLPKVKGCGLLKFFAQQPGEFKPSSKNQELQQIAATVQAPSPILDLHILRGTETTQHQLWQLLQKERITGLSKMESALWDISTLSSLADKARSSQMPELAGHIDSMVNMEHVLVTAEYLLACVVRGEHGVSLQGIAKALQDKGMFKLPKLKDQWIKARPAAEFAMGNIAWKQDYLSQFDSFADAITNGKLAEALELLISVNSMVMQKRRGAPWFRIQNGNVQVLYSYEAPKLPEDNQKLESLWVNPYFIKSMVILGHKYLQGAKNG